MSNTLIYLGCFILGIIFYWIFPRDYTPPKIIQEPIPTQIIDQRIIEGKSCITYQKIQKIYTDCKKP